MDVLGVPLCAEGLCCMRRGGNEVGCDGLHDVIGNLLKPAWLILSMLMSLGEAYVGRGR